MRQGEFECGRNLSCQRPVTGIANIAELVRNGARTYISTFSLLHVRELSPGKRLRYLSERRGLASLVLCDFVEGVLLAGLASTVCLPTLRYVDHGDEVL